MRTILVDWLIEVQNRFRLMSETLFITVNLIDRYIMRRQVQQHKFQLVGVTAMFIACKYQEIQPPRMQDFVYITNNAYTNDEMREMETKLLQVLEFNVMFPTALSFMETYMRAMDCVDLPTELYSNLLLKLSLTDLEM